MYASLYEAPSKASAIWVFVDSVKFLTYPPTYWAASLFGLVEESWVVWSF